MVVVVGGKVVVGWAGLERSLPQPSWSARQRDSSPRSSPGIAAGDEKHGETEHESGSDDHDHLAGSLSHEAILLPRWSAFGLTGEDRMAMCLDVCGDQTRIDGPVRGHYGPGHSGGCARDGVVRPYEIAQGPKDGGIAHPLQWLHPMGVMTEDHVRPRFDHRLSSLDIVLTGVVSSSTPSGW